MKFSIVVASLLFVASVTACKTKGPLLSMEDAPAPLPAGVSRENAGLAPRTSPLGMGDAIPAFMLEDQKGAMVSAGELMSGKGAIIVVAPADASPAARPAYDWLRRNNSLIRSRGIEPVLITPNTRADNEGITQREDLHVAVLADPGGWVARSFGARERLMVFVAGNDGRVQLVEKSLPDAALAIMAAETLPGKKEKSYFLP